jgi:small acid-soluble spore protein E (minor gamma-type SASP)
MDQQSKTNAQQVRAQNQASKQSPGGYQSYKNEFASAAGTSASAANKGFQNEFASAAGASASAANKGFQNEFASAAGQNTKAAAYKNEFASETSAQQVRQQNSQSMAQKNKQ